MKEIALFFLVFILSIENHAQTLCEVVDRYNSNIDAHSKLDSIIKVEVDMSQKSYGLNIGTLSEETSTVVYSINGDSHSVNKKTGVKINLNQLGESEWETRNIIKEHFNLLLLGEGDSIELKTANDSLFVINKFSNGRNVFYEIDRDNYNLKKRITRYKGNDIVAAFSKYKMIEGLKIPTLIKLSSQYGSAEARLSNYRFTKINNGEE